MDAYTVRDFLFDSYRLISASNPNVPLRGTDQALGIRILNQLLQFYASTGLMLTIAKTLTCPIDNGINTIRFVDNNYPTDTIARELVTLTLNSPSFTVLDGTIYSIGEQVSGNGIPALSAIIAIDGNLVTLNNVSSITGPSTLQFIQPLVIPGIAFIKVGRLANMHNAWLELSGVTYPLIDKSRDEFLAAWKYDPLQGLPRFAIVFPDTEWVDVRLYPAPSQFFQFFIRGKFQLSALTANSDLSGLPQYYIMFFLYAVARDVSMFTGRAAAWTEKLEARYQELYDVIMAASEINLEVTGDEQSLLNGAWRVRAGI